MAEPNGRNGFDDEVVKGFVGRIESLMGDLASERGEYMQRCRTIRDDIKSVIQEAKDEHGVPKKALKALIRTRELENKIQDLEDLLEPDDQTAFLQLVAALGDFASTPLGEAKVQAAAMEQDAKRKGRPRKRKDTDGDEATA
jgi:uncharacterized protein (UPF0335 family)